MRQFRVAYREEPLQLGKKEKCKAMSIDYFELYIAVVDFNNRLNVFNFNNMSKLTSVEIAQADEPHLSFGFKSQLLSVNSAKEITIYSLDSELHLLQRIAAEQPIQGFELSPRSLDDFYILSNRSLKNRSLELSVERPIALIKCWSQPSFDLIFVTETYIELLNNMKSVSILSFEVSQKSRFKYDEQSQLLAMVDQSSLTIFQVVEGKLLLKHSRIQQRVERIQNGCFFQLPFYKKAEYYGDKCFIYFAMCRGKLGELICTFDMEGETHYEHTNYQERKYRSLVPVFRWGNHLLACMEQGTLARIVLYANVQFEKLEFRFTYLRKNEIYQESEDEFDKKVKKPQQALDKQMFMRQPYDPYYVYCSQ